MNLNRPLILASNSPRRQELLAGMGLRFEVLVKEIDESFPDHLKTHEVAEYLAAHKAAAYSGLMENAVFITADTIVCLEEEILNKPGDADHAREMLQKLSGKQHQVITGVCVQSSDHKVIFHDVTTVFFAPLKQTEIDYYISRYKPFDKAGAYGIQEWIGMIGIEKIEGSYFNVMGLPVQKLYTVLKEFGLSF